MSITGLLFFAATEFLLSLSPGPAVLLVISQGMKRGFGAASRGAAGILSGNALYFALSAAGLGALLLASRRLFTVFEVAGAAYLIVLGATMLFRQSLVDDKTTAPTWRGDAFLQGLLTQLSNPKAIVFFTALLPQFVNPRAPVAVQFLILGATSISVELPVLLMYGYLADRGSARYARHSVLVDRIAGGCLIIAGAKLLLTIR
jgi:homoserine/homoserine lactone efflux protein